MRYIRINLKNKYKKKTAVYEVVRQEGASFQVVSKEGIKHYINKGFVKDNFKEFGFMSIKSGYAIMKDGSLYTENEEHPLVGTLDKILPIYNSIKDDIEGVDIVCIDYNIKEPSKMSFDDIRQPLNNELYSEVVDKYDIFESKYDDMCKFCKRPITLLRYDNETTGEYQQEVLNENDTINYCPVCGSKL